MNSTENFYIYIQSYEICNSISYNKMPVNLSNFMDYKLLFFESILPESSVHSKVSWKKYGVDTHRTFPGLNFHIFNSLNCFK